MTLLDEREPTPSLGLIAVSVAVVTAIAFGGIWAVAHSGAAPAAQQQQQEAPTTVEGNI